MMGRWPGGNWRLWRRLLSAALASWSSTEIYGADIVVPGNQIVQGGLSVGVDAENGEDFSHTTLRLKENNLRIDFDDRSTAVGYPANDWRILINDSVSSGGNFFAVEDATAARTPFKISAGAPNNALFMDGLGRIGLKTAEPLLDLHLSNANTPAIRFEQTGGDGLAPHTWDIAGNESFFFVRSVTGEGSRIPFRIHPDAPTGSLDVESDGDVGIKGGLKVGGRLDVAGGLGIEQNLGIGGSLGVGVTAPKQQLHLASDSGQVSIRLEDTSATPGAWDISGTGMGFDVKDTVSGTSPLSILPGAPTNSVFVAANGSVGIGTNLPNTTGAVNSFGKYLNVRAEGNTAETGVCNGVFQGSFGAQNHLVHLNAPVDQKIMRLQCSSGYFTLHVLTDNLKAKAVADVMSVRMANGNIGFKVSEPQHPLHMASGARCTAAGVWTNACSRELKQDIEPITVAQARDVVRGLEPVSYRYKNELDETYAGFIAEDVPELVATRDRKALSAMDITAVLTRVVQDQMKLQQEQQQMLRDQQAVIEAQSSRLDRQEKLLEQQSQLIEKLTHQNAVEQTLTTR